MNKPASLEKRFAAFLIDFLILIPLWLIGFFGLLFVIIGFMYFFNPDGLGVLAQLGDPEVAQNYLSLLFLVIFTQVMMISTVFHLYFILQETRTGQTIGKKIIQNQSDFL